MRDIKSFLANLSHYPGIYQMLDAKGNVIYIGKAKNLKKRVSSYFRKQEQDAKTQSLVKQIADIHITVTHSETEAVLLECNLIKKHKPRYNVLFRDDKSYPYILITKEHPFPRIDIYRGTRQKKNGMYFGPYPSASAVRETINLLQKLFQLRTCSDNYFAVRTRPCLLYQIGRCAGPCVDLISAEEYARNVHMAVLFLKGKSDEIIADLQSRMEKAAEDLDYERAAAYRDQISRLRQIQERQYVSGASGDADVIGFAIQAGVICIQLLSIRNGQILGSRTYFPSAALIPEKKEIISAFISQHYFAELAHIDHLPKQIIVDTTLDDVNLIEAVLAERAKHQVKIIHPLKGEKKKWQTMANNSAKQSLTAHLFNKTNIQERFLALQKALRLKTLPTRIECFDISHSMGEATVASCVVFDETGPMKSDYRRFNIKEVTPGDDIAAMHQVVTRRFKGLQKNNTSLPSIILIDGGKAQLAIAKKALDELNIHSVLLIGVAKGVLRKPGYETLHFTDQDPLHLPADSLALHFIQQIRDEAHRFAITHHRQRRDKTRRQSVLEYIPGIGPNRRRELLRYFGGIQGLAHASLEELMKVPGISRYLAERIFTTLHDATL